MIMLINLAYNFVQFKAMNNSKNEIDEQDKYMLDGLGSRTGGPNRPSS